MNPQIPEIEVVGRKFREIHLAYASSIDAYGNPLKCPKAGSSGWNEDKCAFDCIIFESKSVKREIHHPLKTRADEVLI